MQLGIFTRVFQDISFDEMVKQARGYGFKTLELTANYKSKHINIMQPDIEHILQIIEQNDLQITSLDIHRDSQLFLGAKGKDTYHFYQGTSVEQQEYAEKVLYQIAEVTKQLNVRVVVGNIGCLDFSDIFEWPSKSGWKNQLSIAKEKWMPILERYYTENIIFAHEIGPQQLAFNTETALELADVFENIPSLGFCIDPSQLLYTGINISDCIESLGKKVVNFHAKDAEFNHTVRKSGILAHGNYSPINRGYRSRIPGWGDVDWKKTLTSLKIIDYQGPISVEIEDQFLEKDEALKKTIAFLSPLLFK